VEGQGEEEKRKADATRENVAEERKKNEPDKASARPWREAIQLHCFSGVRAQARRLAKSDQTSETA
jgi:hypothetical protein